MVEDDDTRKLKLEYAVAQPLCFLCKSEGKTHVVKMPTSVKNALDSTSLCFVFVHSLLVLQFSSVQEVIKGQRSDLVLKILLLNWPAGSRLQGKNIYLVWPTDGKANWTVNGHQTLAT